MSQISLRQITKSFGNTQVIKSLDLDIDASKFVCFLGPSGCGKTTLLRMIAGLESPTSGQIFFGEKRVVGSGFFLPPEKRQVGMVFQNYAVWPHLNVFDNVAFPLRMHKLPRAEIMSRAGKALQAVKLKGLENRMSYQLSGGQLQRVAIARALVSDPKVLLLDEPFSNLDVVLRDELREEVKRLQVELGITTLLVTHDQKEALSLSDHIVVLEGGIVQDSGSPEKLYTDSKNSFVKGFVTGAQSVRWQGQEVLVSPHQWEMSAASSGAPKNGEILAILFMGDYQDVLVKARELSEDPIKVRVFSQVKFEKRQAVQIRPRAQDL